MDELEALALAAAAKRQKGVNTNPGVNPDAPPEMFFNPQTGQYTSRELLANNMEPGLAKSTATGAYQGLSFGGGDEAMGAINALIPGQGTMSERYTFGREYMRAQEEAAERDHPIGFTLGEVGGAVGTGLAYGMPAMASRGTLPAAVAGAGVGAAEGTVYGALSGEGSARDRALSAVQGAGFGTAGGFAAPLAVSAGRQAFQTIGDVAGGSLDYFVGKGRQGRANRALADTMQRANMTPDDLDAALIAAQREGQGVYRPVDALGVAGQRRASGVARSGGDASEEIADYLRQRQLDQSERVGSFVDDAFDLGGGTSRGIRETVQKGRDEAADIAFGNIRSNGNPVDVRGAVAVLDDKIGTFENAGIEGEAMSALRSLRGRLAGEGADGATYELSDFDRVFAIRKQLRDDISALYRQGRNQAAADLKEVRAALDDALAESSDQYRAAMDDFAASSRVMDATGAGERAARPGQRAGDTVTEFDRLSPDEKAGYRIGYGDKVAGRIEGATEGTNTARQFTKTKVKDEAQALAIDPDLLLRRMGRENTMFETANRALGGSRTADNLADMEDLRGVDVGVIGNVIAGRPTEAIRQALAKGGSALTGTTPETRRIIARALMAPNADAFRTAVNAANSAQQRKQVMDLIARMLAQKTEYGGLVEQ